jgi:hypothetical protein
MNRKSFYPENVAAITKQKKNVKYLIRHNDGHQYAHANTKTTIRHEPYYKTTENPSWS